jgi:hypothetical protein
MFSALILPMVFVAPNAVYNQDIQEISIKEDDYILVKEFSPKEMSGKWKAKINFKNNSLKSKKDKIKYKYYFSPADSNYKREVFNNSVIMSDLDCHIPKDCKFYGKLFIKRKSSNSRLKSGEYTEKIRVTFSSER